MKSALPALFALLLAATRLSAHEGGLQPATLAGPAPAVDDPAGHPVKGVIMGLMPDKSALLVKHEAVPGVMRAMTMVFKVDPAVFAKVQRKDTISARMVRRADGWWLTEVEVLPQKH